MQNLLIEELMSQNGPLSGASIKRLVAVSGGCIHDSWKLVLDDDRELFLKTNTHEAFEMFQSEFEGLIHLSNFSDKRFLVVPKPINVQKTESFSILLMPWLNLGGCNQELLGNGLAKLHKNSSENSNGCFGWNTDSFIGSNPQMGGWSKCWGECFFELRLLPQLNMAKSWDLNVQPILQISSLLIDYLNLHNPVPSIVHGDLWSGNAFVQDDGKGVLLDPAVWWADREVDLSMSKLFGGFSQNFYRSYESIWPLDINFKDRIEIYNLYHLLNHANLFGGSYKNQCFTTLKKILNIFQS